MALTVGQVDEHQNKQHDNGIIRTSTIVSPPEEDEGLLILDDEDILYSATTTTSTKQSVAVSFTTPPDVPQIEIKKSDILKITDSSGTNEYQISKAIYSTDGLTLEGVEVFARFVDDSVSGAQGRIYQNINKEANFGGLLVTTREYQSLSGTSYSNADVVQVANPDAATIITKNIKPSEISSFANRYFSITVDGTKSVDLDVYDLASDGSGFSQTIDTVIKQLNAQFSENALSVSAYRVDYDENRPSEIALVHSLPGDFENSYTLEVTRGDDDGLDAMGLTGFEDVVVEAGLGTLYYIQGFVYNSLGLKLSETNLTLLAGTSSVFSTEIDFKEQGVAEGDILVIAGSSSDDGTYVILQVSSTGIGVDKNQLSGGEWAGDSSSDTSFYIYKNSISLNNMAFDESSSGGAQGAIADIFMDFDRNIFYNVRLEYNIEKHTGTEEGLICIVDFEGDPSVYTGDNPGELFAEESIDGNPLLSIDGGPAVELNGVKDSYIELNSGLYNLSFKVYIRDSDSIALFLSPTEPISMTLYGFEEANKEENMLLARALYDSGMSRIVGPGANIPRVFRKMRRGNIGQKDLGSDAIYANQQRPLRETRSNGVISGAEVTPGTDQTTNESINEDDYYVINISSGICYVKGKRFEISSKENLITGILSTATDKLFVAVDQWGGLVFASADGATCACPFNPYDYCILGSIEYDSFNPPIAIDLRLFIDNLDLTVLNAITVSPQKGMGHFTSINKALKYAKRFSAIFPEAGTPTVHLKSGTHRVEVDMGMNFADAILSPQEVAQANYDQGIWINFPVNITGEGDSTILDLYSGWTDKAIQDADKTAEVDNWGYITVVGSRASETPNGDHDVLLAGNVTISDLKLNYCDIIIKDPYIEDIVTGYKLQFKIKLNNIIFNAESTDLTNVAGVYVDDTEDPASGDPKGNIEISNCDFINSSIQFDPTSAVGYLGEFYNITIQNNTKHVNTSSNGSYDENHLIKANGEDSLFDFTIVGLDKNVTITGNTIGMVDTSYTYIDDGGQTRWSTSGIESKQPFRWRDRINQGLAVGRKISIDNLESTGYQGAANLTMEGLGGCSIDMNAFRGPGGGIGSTTIDMVTNAGQFSIACQGSYPKAHFYFQRTTGGDYSDEPQDIHFEMQNQYNDLTQYRPGLFKFETGVMEYNNSLGGQHFVITDNIFGDANSTGYGYSQTCAIGIGGGMINCGYGGPPRTTGSDGWWFETNRSNTGNGGDHWTPQRALHIHHMGEDWNFDAGTGQHDFGWGGNAASMRIGDFYDDSDGSFQTSDIKRSYIEFASNAEGGGVIGFVGTIQSGGSGIQDGSMNIGALSGHDLGFFVGDSDVGWFRRFDSNPPTGDDGELVLSYDLQVNGDAYVDGAITTGGAKPFRIPHPDPDKKDKHDLMHCAIEAPTGGDNLYRWSIDVKDGEAVIELPDYYRFLNKDDMVWVSPADNFGSGFGTIDPSQRFLTVKTNEDGKYNVLLIGTRKDKKAVDFWRGPEIPRRVDERPKAFKDAEDKKNGKKRGC
jgi:hypothetical protein